MEMKEAMRDGVLVITLEGEVMGGEEGKGFQDQIHRAMREETTRVVVDMTGVRWMNSSGLGMLMAGLTTLRGSGGDLKLAAVPDRVRRPIEITRLDRVIQMFASVDEAVASFAEGE